jgi:hypothetical protein
MFSRWCLPLAGVAALLLSACGPAAIPADVANAAEPTACDRSRERVETDNYAIENLRFEEGDIVAFDRPARQVEYDRACAVLVSAKHEQLLGLVTQYLDLAQSQVGGVMVRSLDFEDGVAVLREGTGHAFERTLTAGTPYRFIGVCDNECQDLDLLLLDSAGHVVEQDVSTDSFPQITITPEADGLYRLVLQMYSCSVEPCYAGIRVLESRGNWALDPNYGEYELASGAFPDPWGVDVLAGGGIDMQRRQSSCAGFITENPDVRVMFTEGEAGLPLIISAHSSADTTLIINGADGLWYCDDDSGVLGLNPMVIFETPQSGQYDIWVGAYGGPDSLQPAHLAVSEHTSQ